MPIYPGVGGSTSYVALVPPTTAIYPGDIPFDLFAAEAKADITGKASAAVGLGPTPGLIEQQTVSISGFFSADPGVFEIDIETADIDADGNYVAETTTITAVNASNAFHVLYTVKARFLRAFVKTLTNAVNLTLTAQV